MISVLLMKTINKFKESCKIFYDQKHYQLTCRQFSLNQKQNHKQWTISCSLNQSYQLTLGLQNGQSV